MGTDEVNAWCTRCGYESDGFIFCESCDAEMEEADRANDEAKAA